MFASFYNIIYYNLYHIPYIVICLLFFMFIALLWAQCSLLHQ